VPVVYELAGTGVDVVIPVGVVGVFLLAGLVLLLHHRQRQCGAESVRVDILD